MFTISAPAGTEYMSKKEPAITGVLLAAICTLPVSLVGAQAAAVLFLLRVTNNFDSHVRDTALSGQRRGFSWNRFCHRRGFGDSTPPVSC